MLTEEQAILELGKDIKFSDEQLQILRTEGGIALLAVAGSGKTSTMVNLIAKRIMTGEILDTTKVLCTTFSKGGAEELESRLNALLCKHSLPSVNVSTLHATCYRILAKFGSAPRNVMSEGERLKYLREAAKAVSPEYGRMSQDDLIQLGDTISLQMNSLMTDKELEASSKYVLDLSISAYSDIRDMYATLKANDEKIEFDDMLRYVYEWLCVQKYQPVIDWCRQTWWYLFIDEFQDTNPIQLGIIKAILGDRFPEKRLVVIGDDDQCIYEWRGTDPRILINICGHFDLKKRYLTTNYRCPQEIVKHAGSCVVNISEREPKVMVSSKSGGSISVIDATPKSANSGKTDEKGDYHWSNPICYGSLTVANKIIKQLNGEEGVCKDKDICVLSRNNATMRILSSMLYANGASVRGQSPMMISTSREWGVLKDIVRICTKDEVVDNVDSVMWQLVLGSTSKFAKCITSILVETGCSVDWALELVVNDCFDRGIFYKSAERAMIDGDNQLKGKRKCSEKTMMAVESEISHHGISAESMVYIINALRIENQKEALMRLLASYRNAAAFMYKTASAKRLFDAMVEYFMFLTAKYGFKGLKQFIRATEQFENGKYELDNRVELRTIHGAKGGEWDTVYILMDDNYEFPNIESIKILQQRGIDSESISRYLDSERRLHYVAQTRASRQLFIVGQLECISKFVLESFGEEVGNNEVVKCAEVGLIRNRNKLNSELEACVVKTDIIEEVTNEQKGEDDNYVLKLLQGK